MTNDDTISRQAAIDGILAFMPVELGKDASMAEQVNYSAWRTAISCAESYVRTMPPAQPSVSDCWGCNCPKMERLKEQKTFSEMVHLHDAETHGKRTETHAGDCISRQAAIDAAVEAADEWDGGYSRSREEIITMKLRMLPSAQPEIIRCKDCKHLQIDDMFHDCWCDGRKVFMNHYCGYAERREE